MASKPDHSSPDELTHDITQAIQTQAIAAIDVAAAAFCSSDQGVVFLDDDEDPSAMVIAIGEAERVRGRVLTVLWGLDRSWLAWHWPSEGAPPLLGFMVSDDLSDDLGDAV